MVYVSGIFALVCVVISVVDTVKEYGISAKNIVVTLLTVVAFVIILVEYLSQKTVHFDEKGFTVGECDYNFTDITKVEADTEQIFRNVSVLRLTVYVGEKDICSFRKSDKGAKDFIALMKQYGVPVSIDG